MPLLDDLRTARRLVTNAYRARRRRREAELRFRALPELGPGEAEILVHFADASVNLYQLRQWFAPLAELARIHPVVIVARTPRTALALLEESPIPVRYLRTMGEIERFVDRHRPRITLYVNQNVRNFQMFRTGEMWHVFINHGESDKAYMRSNQHKAYDYAFVAGQAARDRLRASLWDYDVDRRTIMIGRPQADHFAGEPPYAADGRIVVFYAPTWEGDRPTMTYGSIASHGVALAEAVLASPRHRLVYRPHPRSGINDRAYREANRRIVEAIERANAADPSARHVYDDGPVLGWQLAASDVAITDISAMVYDRLATGRPIIVTRPASPEAQVDETGFLGAAEWLRAEEAPDVLAHVDRVLNDPAAVESLRHWSEHHFGDTTPGAATARFHAAIEQLLAEWERQAALHPHEEHVSSSDPLDDEDDDEGLPAEAQED